MGIKQWVPINGIIIKQKEKDKKVGTMVIPDAIEQEINNEATVVAVGDGLNKTWIGRSIIFKEFSGEQIVIDKEKYLIIELDDVLAIKK